MGSMRNRRAHPVDGGERLRQARIAVISSAIISLFTAGMMAGEAMNILAQTLGLNLTAPATEKVETRKPPADERTVVSGIVPADLDIHPDRLHHDYLLAPLHEDADARLVAPEVARSFGTLAEMYRTRQAVDDNFTVRAYNKATGEVLGVYTLDDEKTAFEETGSAQWSAIDRKRRELTRSAVEELKAAGIPREEITVRWGRRDQIIEARRREDQYIEYEVRLARYLGLSLLATEIGTVETFNDDRLVSRVGARGRYQMMPAMLRARSIHHYRLRSRGGSEIAVKEEWHPLLTMEASFVVARAYANAVGHEIPGLSAYHTGPYNIFKVYREYLLAEGEHFDAATNVVGGYLWGLTQGYERVSSRSTFRRYSRSYVPSMYGAVRATEDIPIDTTMTMLTERVQLAHGESIFLSEILAALDGADERLTWRVDGRLSPYERFRVMNPHFDLPPALSAGAVPEKGDVYLVAVTPTGNIPVRFFLPLGAAAELRSREVRELDYDSVFRYDRSTFLTPGEATVWDELYDELVADVRRFGFTFENRARLSQIVDQIEEAYRYAPTHHRQTRMEIARLHERVWASSQFDKLAMLVPAARGHQRLPVQPPEQVGTVDDVSVTTDNLSSAVDE